MPHSNIITKRLVSAFVLSRLDYCNAALAGPPQTTLRPLLHALNAATRLVANLGSCDHITPTMKELHWLPINQHVGLIHQRNTAIYSHTATPAEDTVLGPQSTGVILI